MYKISMYFNPLNYYYYIKQRLLLRKLKSVGKNFIIIHDCRILDPGLTEIGDNVFIGTGAYFSAEIKIGNNVMFGPRCMVLGGDHFFAIKGKSVRFLHPKERENSSQIIIQDEVWCGANVIILKGALLGMGCVIGAGSIISKPIPPYTVALGAPCLPIKTIFDDETLVEHLKLLGYSKEQAIAIRDRRTSELKILNLENLPSIDKTKTYWECQDQ